MTTPANALNITEAGLVKFDGISDFTAETVTQYNVLVGDTANGITSVSPSTSGKVLTSNGVAADPSFQTITNPILPGSGQITLTDGTNITITGSPVALGGAATVNVSGPPSATTLTNHGVVIGQGTSAVTATATGSAGQVLQSGGASANPTYSTATYPSTAGTSGNIIVSDGTNFVSSAVSFATSYPCDSGTATPSGGLLTLAGQNSGSHPVMDTTGSGATATFENRAHLTPIVVDSSTSAGTRGTYSTIAAALTAASSGNDIFIRPGTYTENLTLKAGVNLIAFKGDELTPSVTIIGNATATFAGTCTLSNLRLQTNSAACLTVSGSSATIVNLESCYINATNNTGITYSSSSGSSIVRFINCRGDIGTTGIALYAGTGAGSVNFEFCKFTNSGGATTASTMSSTGQYFMRYSYFENVFSNSGTGAGLQIFDCVFNSGSLNTTVFALSSTAGGGGTIERCFIGAGTATAITIAASAEVTINHCNIQTSNSSAISGAGQCSYGNITFQNSGLNAATIQVPLLGSNDCVRVVSPGAYPYTTVPENELILVDTSSARTITPLASPHTGQKHIIKDSVGSAASNNITITPSGKNIDGAASSTINIAYGSVTIIFNGTEWNIC